jgi:hypothetical protein
MEESSIDSNSVTITGSMITGMAYIDGSFDITQGQAGAPPPDFAQSGSEWTITILANRQNNPDVANSFNSVSGGSGHQFAGHAYAHQPTDLNFYFGVNMMIQTNNGQVTIPVYLGQGSVASRNNWWFGSQNLTYGKGQSEGLLQVGGSDFTLSGGVSNFDLAPFQT